MTPTFDAAWIWGVPPNSWCVRLKKSIRKQMGGPARSTTERPHSTFTKQKTPWDLKETDLIRASPRQRSSERRGRYWISNNPSGSACSLGGWTAGWTYVHAYHRVGRRIEVALLVEGLGNRGTWQHDNQWILARALWALSKTAGEVLMYVL